ncbi:MAG: glutamine--fructose-6-phosphate transaminase (isomerizing) [Alphaproteobacteria bacterium]|nr:glutamine--fructose-6-phosphate transaminase (isomerizing) [Alphaproteobacteria bacterium]MBP7759516.1 glutamine--fructose-6-phosphate transaminase (isomerizing) [Alphaproteobacteria bacterium]MBP7762912.1 glutamine--fructose-6-phosphate transaminase (isomerizing) [Alphaproteobacteria bacterium]MBP7905605.1 glutamine--fructose-6-phosphate transaminase (isomerizing) [Alphaproteobacteria bacterium]
MCGIVGIIGEQKVVPLLVEGLKRLEYRGYDSAGVATLSNGHIQRCRAEGKLERLESKLTAQPLQGTVGIGHTRWATHGAANENNAHPHATDRVAVVHNGIIENYAELKRELQETQARFTSDTDTEVIVHLVTRYLSQGMKPVEAANAAFDRLHGAYAIVMIFAGEHDLMIGVRQGTPLAVGYGEGEMYLASDSYALAPLTRKICFLEDGDRVTVTRTGAKITGKGGQPVERPIRITAQSGATAGKGEYRHFMLKEIYEQPAVIADTLNSYVNPATGHIAIPQEVLNVLSAAPRITLIACGTAYYACAVAKYWFEQVARIPCEIDVASEFRYREAPMPANGAAIFVSQSGETLDTLEALRYCKRQKQTIISIVNTIESTIERESDHVLHTLAGPEIGVASTKAFTTQLATLACMALAAALKTGAINEQQGAEYATALRHVPTLAAQILTHDGQIKNIARDVAEARDVLYLGRGSLYPIALEGALKLKEISYIHAEGYAAGEMKHGPIALIDETVPVVVVAPGGDPLFEKNASNIQETVARGGKVFLISDEKGAKELENLVTWSVATGAVHPFVAPILYAIPVQLLAYHVAVIKGTDVDQPRNLAKSVTVE